MNDALSRPGCAFCEKSDAPLTKEHLWPTSLHRRRVAVDQEQWQMWTGKVCKDLPTEFTIKDVCARCNNGFMSELDAYICELFERYFARVLERGEKVSFEFDYHRLKRWLLKMSYKSARLNSANDAGFVFPPLLRYIRGEADADGRSVQVFVELTPPGSVPVEHAPLDATPEQRIVRPTSHRAGRLLFRTPDGRKKLLRTVHLRSYLFLLAFFEPKSGGSAARNVFADAFSAGSSATLLRPSTPRVELLCNGIDAWTSLSGARGTTFVFDE